MARTSDFKLPIARHDWKCTCKHASSKSSYIPTGDNNRLAERMDPTETATNTVIAYGSISCMGRLLYRVYTYMYVTIASTFMRHHLTKPPRLSPILCPPHSSSGESLGIRTRLMEAFMRSSYSTIILYHPRMHCYLDLGQQLWGIFRECTMYPYFI